MSSIRFARRTLLAATASASLFATDAASAGAKFSIDDTRWVSVGAGLRTSFSSVEDAAPDDGRSNDFTLDSIRLYLNAQLHEHILPGPLARAVAVRGLKFISRMDKSMQIATANPDSAGDLYSRQRNDWRTRQRAV